MENNTDKATEGNENVGGGAGIGAFPDYGKALKKCVSFLKNYVVEVFFEEEEGQNSASPSSEMEVSKQRRRSRQSYKYLELITEVAKRRHGSLVRIDVELDDIVRHQDATFAAEISMNTNRYLAIFSKAIDQIVTEMRREGKVRSTEGSGSSADVEEIDNVDGNAEDDIVEAEDVAEVVLRHRMMQIKQNRENLQLAEGGVAAAALRAAGGGGEGVGQQLGALTVPLTEEERVEAERKQRAQDEQTIRDALPADLFRRYEVRIRPRLEDEKNALSLRNVKAKDLGKLVTIKAIVLRSSDVKPQILVATFTCDICAYENYQPVSGKSFTPLPTCQSDSCKDRGRTGKVFMTTRGCKFQKYQEVKIQELPEQVPVGNIPRSMTVICRGETTRNVQPGDIVTIGGIFLPTPYTGFKAITAGITTDTYLEAMYLTKTKKQDSAVSEEGMELIKQLYSDENLYDKLAKSIAPEIFGHDDVKKALLLQLVGGMSRKQKDGMKTRGDLHICLMGDPGVAKSQLLKHMQKLATRCVYTTGKGSSGVGLTAAVVKDPLTRELVLEGGALVLADMGICAIDEFDKMDERDRTSIHEVMEQQTVSIAKAGITTTLNARTAVLAAANPKFGRYNRYADRDPHVALLKNINLPAALLSRFDLMFLLLDEVDSANDRALAEHVTYVHKHEKHPPLAFTPLDPGIIRQYVSVAKHISTHVPPELTDYLCEAFVDIRERDKVKSARSGGRGSITARQLLSILRLAESRARLHFRSDVTRDDVNEAIRLVNVSKSSVDEPVEERDYDGKGDRGGSNSGENATTKIFRLIMQRAKDNGFVHYEEMREVVLVAGFSDEQFKFALQEYLDLNVVQLNASHTRIDVVGR